MVTTRRVIVLYDGTWCGREANTTTNIYILSRMIGINLSASPAVHTSGNPDIRARYFDGVGLGSDFISYLWNGAFATQAKSECTAVYDFIVQNFIWTANVHTEVWLFGISRGAYIVRSVGGMINNCGIIRNARDTALINNVYELYRSPHAAHLPSSPEMRQFREKVSYSVRSPIKFMGIFDTVGSRGVPRLNYHTGSGFEWPEFYDDLVSSAVEKVYHAVAIHDRFWAFQPCLASRNKRHQKHPGALEIHQQWFPGCHYDLARQEFQFFREGGTSLERLLFFFFNIFSNTVYPNEKLADLVLLWMLQGIHAAGGGEIVQGSRDNPRNIAIEIDTIQRNVHARSTTKKKATGDMYDKILSYLPGGWLFVPLAWWRGLDKTIYYILFKPVERVIPDPGIANGTPTGVWNEVYHYQQPDPNNGWTIATIANVHPPQYPSKTYQNYLTYMAAVRRP